MYCQKVKKLFIQKSIVFLLKKTSFDAQQKFLKQFYSQIKNQSILELNNIQQQLFLENEEWEKQKELIQQYIDELEQKALVLNNQMKEKDEELENMKKLNYNLNDQLVELKNINEKAQKLEKICVENTQKFEEQIDQINLKNILKNNEFIKQIQQLQSQSQEDQLKIQDLKKQLDDKENSIQEKEGRHAIEIQLITTNYMNRLKDKDDAIQNLQQEIQSYQQVEQEQQNVIKFLESVKENLEQQKCENFEYIVKQLQNKYLLQFLFVIQNLEFCSMRLI